MKEDKRSGEKAVGTNAPEPHDISASDGLFPAEDAPMCGAAGDELLLGINEVVELTGISAFTIRYYDKCGFFPNLIRGKRGVRSFRAQDIRQLRLVDALRRSGLSIEGIGFYVRRAQRAGDADAELKQILQTQANALEYQIEEERLSLALLKDELSRLGDASH